MSREFGEEKCSRCFERKDCRLWEFAHKTLPCIKDALEQGLSEAQIKQVMRGTKTSPGFIGDWTDADAMLPEDIKRLVKEIIKKGDADMAMLCNRCRLFQGPDK